MASNKKEQIPALTSIRGLAAMMIIVHHLQLVIPLRDTIFFPALSKLGALGMFLFFILSGFVISYNYSDKIRTNGSSATLDFLAARAARLYPLFIFFVIVNFIYNITLSSSYWSTIFYYIFGVQSWFYGVKSGVNISISQQYANNSWSISTEFFLYLLYIPIARFICSKNVSTWRGVLLLVVAIVGRFLFNYFARIKGAAFLIDTWGQSPSCSALLWLTYFSPYGRFFDFLSGMALSEIWIARSRRKNITVVDKLLSMCGFISVVYVILSLFDGSVFNNLILFRGDNWMSGYIVFIPLALLFCCTLKGKLASLFSFPIALTVGEVSYSMYLIHSMLIPLFHTNSKALSYTSIVNVVLFVSTTFFLSLILYKFVELPSKNAILMRYKKFKNTASNLPPPA